MEISNIKINQYINGELTGELLEAFEATLATNKDLRDEIKQHKEIDTVLMKNYLDLDDEARKKEKENLQPIFDELGEKYFKKENKSTAIIRRLMPIVIFTVAAALLLFFFNPFTNKTSPTQLAVQNFELYQLDASMGSSDLKATWTEAIKNYRAENYEVAITKFDSYLKDNPNNKEALLAKGCALLKLNKTDLAIQTFQQINNSKTANWYLALSYLKNDEVTKAQPILEGLLDNKKYGAKAKAILRDL